MAQYTYSCVQSKQSLKRGDIKTARNQGLLAAYMNMFAVIAALVVAAVVTGLVIRFYGPTYYRDKYDYECDYYCKYTRHNS